VYTVTSTTTPGPARGTDRPVSELVSDVSELVSRLVRDELRLAKVELTEKGKRAGAGAGMFAAAGLVAFLGVATLVAFLVLVLALAMPAWVSALVVGVVLLAAAGGIALAGRGQVRKATPPAPEEAIENVKRDVETVKERAHR
jgi:uncharacterized membrane protein YqjE